MPRCGCSGQCSCRIQEGRGTNVSGVGSANDPYVLAIDGADLVGNGLAWDSVNQRFQVRTAGSGLGFDGSGALVNTGSGDGGASGNPYPLVSDLIARGQDVIGGLHGGGYMIKPAQLKRSFEYGIERGLDVIHVPVRFLADGTPVVHIAESMGSTNLSTIALSTSSQVQTQDLHRWRILPLEPGMWNPRQAWQPDGSKDPLTSANWTQANWHPNAPSHGWFGFQEPNQYGMTTLDDVIRLCAGWTCVVLNLRWPKRVTSGGAFEAPTPTERTQRFLSEVDRIIDKYRMGESVIIASGEKTIPGASGEVSVFERYFNKGVACGMWLEDPAAVTANPPDATWDTRATWAFPHWQAGEAAIGGYVTAGYHVLAHPVNRQFLRLYVNRAGALGVLSGDPEYYAGQISANTTLGNYRYRKNTATWDYDTVDHGLMPPNDHEAGACAARRRGYMKVGDNSQWYGQEAGFTTGSGTYWVLQGWMCPITNPTNWALDVWIGWDPLPPSASDVYLGLAFGILHDYDFRSWAPYTAPAEDPAKSGYTFTYGSNGYTSLQAWSGSAITNVAPPAQVSGFGVGLRRFRIGVNSLGLRISQWDAAGAFLKDHAVATTSLATAHRGSYLYFGRSAPSNNTAVGVFGSAAYLPGQGSTYGPQ